MTDPASPVPAPPDPAEHDLELTVSALKDGPAALGIPGALVEIRRWQERIDGTDAPAQAPQFQHDPTRRRDRLAGDQ